MLFRSPAEQFAQLQRGTGLQSMQDGRFRNPETGDIMQAARAPNGQVVPVPMSQSEIDSLPPNTRYIDRASGKLLVSQGQGNASGGRPGSASGQSMQGGQGGQAAPMSAEDAFAAYEKWGKKVDPGSTNEERKVVSDAIALIQDPNEQKRIAEIEIGRAHV